MANGNNKQQDFFKNITAAGGIAGSITAVLVLWLTLDSRIENSSNQVKDDVITEIQASTKLITREIYTSDYQIVESLRDMMNIRIRVRDIEISRLQSEGKRVPERYLMEREAMKDMLEELDRKWATN